MSIRYQGTNDNAQQAREQGCRCGGVLHSARYPRKPRGIERQARAYCDFRYSFYCALNAGGG